VEHAQPHAKALKELGHEVEIIYPYVARNLSPGSYDVYVCRVESVSHSAFDKMNEWKREGRQIVFENSKTKIIEAIEKIAKGQQLTEEEKNMKLTRPERLQRAVDATGIYSPRVTFTEVMFGQLFALGFAPPGKSRTDYIRSAMEAVTDYAQISDKSQGGPWTEMLSRPGQNITSFYRRTKQGRVQIKMVTRRPLRSDTAKLAALILGLEYGYREDSQQSDTLAEAMVYENTTPLAVAQATENLPPEPEETEETLESLMETNFVESSPEVEIPVVEVEAPAPVVAPVISAAPKKSDAKSDLKEIVTMLNEALLSLNIADFNLVPSVDGPKIQISQVVVRKVTSIEGLE